MQEVNLCIETTFRGPAAREGWYMYLLECEHPREKGKMLVRTGLGHLSEGTENQAVLTAMIEAAKRFRKPCSIRVFTECEHILSAAENRWPEQWIRNGWKNAKGKPVGNAELWKRLMDLLDPHEVICIRAPDHPRKKQMQEALEEKEKEKKAMRQQAG